ncbi:MAG: membrane protein insertion efficiency factor YidD [Thermodesulfobacteriota bacterium]
MVKKGILLIIKGYRYLISPLFPPSCRFTPTCSSYALTAIECHGVFKGGYMAVRRILRCHPFSPGGYDPVQGHCHCQKKTKGLL